LFILRWKIRARCFAKSPIRPHPVCNFDFVDASGEIRLTAFRDECARFHPMIEIDKVNLFQINSINQFSFPQKIYDILGVRVKTADKRWNNLRHTYELILAPVSIVRLVDDSTINSNIPDIHYEFIPLRDIAKHSNESFIGRILFLKILFFFNIIFVK
jgi:replication factor A1